LGQVEERREERTGGCEESAEGKGVVEEKLGDPAGGKRMGRENERDGDDGGGEADLGD
jgi:hypothetical protein